MGIYLFSPSTHEAIVKIKPSSQGELEITDAIQKLLDIDKTVKSHILDKWWLDTGEKDDFLEANCVILDELIKKEMGGKVDDRSRVVGRVSVAEGAKIEASTIRGPAIIGAGSLIKGSFIGPYTSIGNNCVVEDAVVEHSVIFDGARVAHILRLEDSVLDRNAIVCRSEESHRALRLMVGDDTEVKI